MNALATGKLQHLINTHAHKAIVSGSGSGLHELPSSAEQAGVALQGRINKIIRVMSLSMAHKKMEHL